MTAGLSAANTIEAKCYDPKKLCNVQGFYFCQCSLTYSQKNIVVFCIIWQYGTFYGYLNECIGLIAVWFFSTLVSYLIGFGGST